MDGISVKPVSYCYCKLTSQSYVIELILQGQQIIKCALYKLWAGTALNNFLNNSQVPGGGGGEEIKKGDGKLDFVCTLWSPTYANLQGDLTPHAERVYNSQRQKIKKSP